MSRYIIRPPFAVHLERWEEAGGRKVKVEEHHIHNSESKSIELSDADAVAHMHKLEPADREAKALFEKVNAENEAARRERTAASGNETTSEERMLAAMIKLGLVAPADKPKSGAAAGK